MFAVLALIAFVVALLGLSHIGPLDSVVLGLTFIAAHFVFGWVIPWGPRPRSGG
jgi:hypothetical protein